MSRAPRLRDESGFSLVEVIAAMVVLVIGVLGVLASVDTSNEITQRNLSRDTGTTLVREQIERTRDLPYSDLATPSKIASGLATAMQDTTAPITNGTVFTTTRRGITYTTTVTSCVIDDPSDGIGVAPGQACKPLPASSGGGGTVSGGSGSSTLSLNVLGIPVTGGGSVVDAVCNLLGRNSILDALIGSGGALSGLISSGADVGVCSSSNSNVAVDRQAADATAVTSTVTWTRPRAGRVSQRTVVTGPRLTS